MSNSWVTMESFILWKRPLKRYKNQQTREPGASSDLLKSVLSSGDEVKSGKLKSTKVQQSMDSQVCFMTESPFRIMKMAAHGNLPEVERLYIDDKTRLTLQDAKGWNVLHHAVANGSLKIIHYLAKQSIDLNSLTNSGITSLHISVLQDQPQAMDQLIIWGADTTIQDPSSRTPLHLATQMNKVPSVEILMKHIDKIDLRAVDDQGRTALHIAARFDFDDIAKLLLDSYDFCPNQACNNGFSPIHIAAKNASVGVLEALLNFSEVRGCERKKMITLPDLEGNAPLHLAVHGGDIKAVELCLKNGANISRQQHDNSTAVHLASSQGAVDIVKLMLDTQPDEKKKVLETQDAQGMTPLHCAAMFNHEELIHYLILEGASVNSVDKDHRTPLLLAASQKCWKSVNILLNHGADPGIRDLSNKNILHVVIVNGGSITDIFGYKQTTAMTPELVVLLNDQDKFGCSPMHYASKSGQIRSLMSLIQLGASVRVKNMKNESPLHFAARYGRYNTVRQLLDSVKGFLIMNECDECGMTALHIASEEGHTRVLQLLLSRGALLHRDHQGRTPLHLAAHGGHVGTIAALLVVWSHLLDQKDKDGNTPFHLATKNNKPGSISQLLSSKCKVLKNNCRFLPIDYAIQYKLYEAAIAIVTHERGIELYQVASEIHGCICIALIRTLPKVFEAALNKAITRPDVKEDSKDFYVNSFRNKFFT